MEFVEGVPLLDAPLDYESRRDAARLVFRRLILGPLFSGLPESIFHADPHAGNLMVQTQKPLRKAFLTLDGTPISMPGWKPSQHACGVSASEAVVGTWSILYPYPWLGRPDFYRSGLPQANARGLFRGHDPKQVLCRCKTNVDAFRKSVRYCCLNKLRNQPEPSQRKEERKKHECYRYQEGNVGKH
jgi:hypothetical protein